MFCRDQRYSTYCSLFLRPMRTQRANFIVTTKDKEVMSKKTEDAKAVEKLEKPGCDRVRIQVDRRDGRRDRRDDDRHLRPRALPFGRRTRFGQDFARELVGRDHVPWFQAYSVHARLDALGHYGNGIASGGSGNSRAQIQVPKGPVFTNLLLADEINRTPPKTQAALLEAMQEKRVSSGGEDFKLDEPFFVLATQNPIEQEGTYPLPEAQLDRFRLTSMSSIPARARNSTSCERNRRRRTPN